MNFAEELVKEIKEEEYKELWEAEDFMRVFYPNYAPEEEQKNIKISSFYIPFLNPSSSGDISFKFNYNHGNKEPLEELGIEVVK